MKINPSLLFFHRRFSCSCLVSLSLLFLTTLAPTCLAEIAVRTGEKIVFLGDSITAGGAASPSGYVQLVMSGLEANGVKASAVPAGIIRQKSTEMLARLDRDVLLKKPIWMTLSCGLNDVWQGERGVPLELFKKNISEIVDRAQSAGIKVLILTLTLIGEDPQNANNQKAIVYNDALRNVATEKNCLLADVNGEMRSTLKQASYAKADDHQLTIDGVNLNPLGHQIMAIGILKAFGLNEAQLENAEKTWLDQPTSCDLPLKVSVSLREYVNLRETAKKRSLSMSELINEAAKKSIKELIVNKPESEDRSRSLPSK
ncbi:MAG: acyl-CoA thioesterase [Chthoniobacter sp.]|jgi:lysophospholipase L1-like esterase|nr:acyl-CoA thioesterase [Chthoniobacter sp.]